MADSSREGEAPAEPTSDTPIPSGPESSFQQPTQNPLPPCGGGPGWGGEQPQTSSPANARETTTFPTEGRLLGLDYGTKRIGIAISTPDQAIASPIENYSRQTLAQDAKRLLALAKEYDAVGVVVGLPVHMSGDEGKSAAEARAFGAWAAAATALPVCFWDERHTSSHAEEQLLAAELTKKKRKARMDMLAAMFMLQSFLDTKDRQAVPKAY